MCITHGVIGMKLVSFSIQLPSLMAMLPLHINRPGQADVPSGWTYGRQQWLDIKVGGPGPVCLLHTAGALIGIYRYEVKRTSNRTRSNMNDKKTQTTINERFYQKWQRGTRASVSGSRMHRVRLNSTNRFFRYLNTPLPTDRSTARTLADKIRY